MYNHCTFMGNLTRDPELKDLPSGATVCNFGIATNYTYLNRDGDKKDEACFIDVEMFGRRGEVIAEYFEKGKPILVTGRLRYNTWETDDGEKRGRHVLSADNFSFIPGTRSDDSNGNGGAPAAQGAQQQSGNSGGADPVPF